MKLHFFVFSELSFDAGLFASKRNMLVNVNASAARFVFEMTLCAVKMSQFAPHCDVEKLCGSTEFMVLSSPH